MPRLSGYNSKFESTYFTLIFLAKQRPRAPKRKRLTLLIEGVILTPVAATNNDDVARVSHMEPVPLKITIRGVAIMYMEFTKKAIGVLGVCLKYYCLVGAAVFLGSFCVTLVTVLNG